MFHIIIELFSAVKQEFTEGIRNMRALTVLEFQNWAKQTNPAYYVFSSENNREIREIGITMGIRFQSLDICASMNRLCFRNGRDTLCLECVKEVHMYDDRKSIGVIFDVVCEQCNAVRVWHMIAD